MRIMDIIQKDFICVKESDLIENVLDIMNTKKSNSLPAVDNNGHLSGIVVKSDIYRFMVQPGHYDSCPVNWVMSKEVVSIGPNESIREAAMKLLNNHIVAMPVVENNKVLGVVTMEDLLEYYAKQDI